VSWPWSYAVGLVLASAALSAVGPAPVWAPDVPYAEQPSDPQTAVRLYQDVLAGRRKIESLTRDELEMVRWVQRLMRRGASPSDNSECRDAKDSARSAADDLATYSRRLASCAENSDFRDDCSSEFSRVRSAHSDFEDAVSRVQSECD
jgi:hypothetical protein